MKSGRRILHVLTYARPVGGDTRFVWRWIQLDKTNQHSVAITGQSEVKHLHEIPEMLKVAVAESGGSVSALNASSAEPLEQARELRELCQGMDIIVLHLYPHDIIPVMALAAGCDSARVAISNLADHTFWIGASVVHGVLHLRRQSEAFLRQRRGLEPGQFPIVGIPMINGGRYLTRAEAKRALGYDPDTVLLLTIASPFKYDPLVNPQGRSSGHHFLEMVVPVLKKLPESVLVAVGPCRDGAWEQASVETHGRVVALGTRWDNALLYAAADIYLDSVPFSSVTSLLEAGSCGTPLLGYVSPDPELDLLGPGAPGLDDAMELASDATTYQNLLIRLIQDREYRRQSGRRVQEKIKLLHTGREWLRTLDEVYVRLEGAGERNCLKAGSDRFEEGAFDQAITQLYSAVPAAVPRHQIQEYLGPLPYKSRLAVLRRLHGLGFPIHLLNWLPPSIDRPLRAVGRWFKRLVRPGLRPMGN